MSTVIMRAVVIGAPVEGSEIDGEDDDSDENSNRRHDVRRSSQAARTLHVRRRLVTSRRCTYRLYHALGVVSFASTST